MVAHLVPQLARSLPATIGIVVIVSAAAIAAAVRPFGLTVAGAIALYFVIWWTLLFAVLPFHVRSQAEEGSVARGTDPGAPEAPRLREKAIWTTLAAAAALIAVAGLFPLTGL